MSLNIISKLKESGITGRGGSDFPVGQKWQMVKNMNDKTYIICNASESEPGVFKDGYLLDTQMEKIIEGIEIALDTFQDAEAYIYLRQDYFFRFRKKLEKATKDLPIQLYCKTGGYLFGEETTLISDIEGEDPPRPRIKPPYPAKQGLHGKPTLVNNTETFYNVALLDNDEYKKERIYSISGDVKKEGVCKLPDHWSIHKVLRKSNNYPKFDFFVQAGGGISGEILLPKELNKPVASYGALVVYDRKKTDFFDLMSKWADFFMAENCDRCTPCREGIYRMKEMFDKERRDKKLIKDMFFVLKETSYCNLGKRAWVPFEGLINKLLT